MSTSNAIPTAGYLLTGGRMYVDTVHVGVESAESRRSSRNDGAVIEQLVKRSDAEAEIARLHGLLAEKLDAATLLTELHMTPGEVFMGFEGGAAHLLAMGLADQFDTIGGTNYVELRFDDRKVPGRSFTVTIQRVSGLTPAQKIADLTERMVVLERQRDDYLNREWIAEKAKRHAEADAGKLRAFAQELVLKWLEDGIANEAMQDMVEKYGLLATAEVTGPCGERCACAKSGPFPRTCYRTTPLLMGAGVKP